MSIRIERLKETFKLLGDSATITFKEFAEIQRQFDTAIQQVEDLEKSRDNWRKKYEELKGPTSPGK